MAFFSLLALLASVVAASTDPAAPPVSAAVAKRTGPDTGFVVINLRGHSQAGHKRRAYVTSLPASGSLYQLSQPYMQHGRLPAYVPSGLIAAASPLSPVLVTSTKNKLIYVTEAGVAEPMGEWGRFTYKVQATSTQAYSPLGSVVLVPPSKILVASSFSMGAESWVVRGGRATADITFERTRSGGLSNFVHATDDNIDIRADGSDAKRWSFCAPHKYLTNYELAYRGTLGFTLRSFAGDFNKLNDQRDMVTLQCSTCNQNRGMKFVQRDVAWSGEEKAFVFELSETGRWLKDSKNSLVAWEPPTECEMVEMLSSISELCILGDHTKWYETVGLDNVAIRATDLATPMPLGCICNNPGTQC